METNLIQQLTDTFEGHAQQTETGVEDWLAREQRLLEAERVSARKKLTDTEKELSHLIYEQTGGNEDFALDRSRQNSGTTLEFR
jgi:hypothetical protein